MNKKNPKLRLFEIMSRLNGEFKINEEVEDNEVILGSDRIEKKEKGFHVNIEQETLDNDNFRKVLFTAKNMQLVLMTLKPNEDIGMETHPNIDQFFRFESGMGKCIINNDEYDVKDGDSIIIPAGSEHNIINTGEEPLKMYTIYSPPHHEDGIVVKNKEEA